MEWLCLGCCSVSIPPPPPGFVLEKAPKKRGLLGNGRTALSQAPKQIPPPPLGFQLDSFTGEVVDGDTFRLPDGNARLWGADAFEARQQGRNSSGALIPIGKQATNHFDAFVTPQSKTIPSGLPDTWGRPVLGIETGGQDGGRSMIDQGFALAAPDYLKDDPARQTDYMESERLARQNRRGSHALTVQSPRDWRAARGAERDDKIAVFKDEPIPWGGLRPEIESGYLALFADPETTAKDLQDYATHHNFSVNSREAVNSIKNTGRAKFRSAWLQDNIGIDTKGEGKLVSWLNSNRGNGNVSAQSVQQAYVAAGVPSGKLPSMEKLENTAKQLRENKIQFGGFNTGTTSQIQRKLAELAKLPRPMTDDGTGAMGAALRGGGDIALVSMLDEVGGLYDTVGGTPARESLLNSDRRFGDILWNNIDQNRAILSYDEENHPYARLGGQVAGAFALPFATAAKTPAALARVGAVEGGAYAFGSGQGGFVDRAKGVPLGATIGATGGAVLGKGAQLAAPYARRLLDTSRERVSPLIDGARSVFGRNTDVPEPPPGFTLDDDAQVALNAMFDQAAGKQTAAIDSGLEAPALRENIPPPPPGYQIEAMDSGLDSPVLREAMGMPNPSANRPQLTDNVPPPPPGFKLVDDTASLTPDELLPIPANRVDGVDEAAQIDAGRFDPLKPVDERSLLESRGYRSNANPENILPRKGPLDLVSWVRSQGGLQDQGKELTQYGMDNSVRNLDFAQAENRLGKLVDDQNGARLDDMAEAAFEAGFFPDNLERPSVNEFLEALSETHSGANRRFLPDDFDELDAFNQQRDLNNQIGKAAEDGAPLINDKSYPAELSDLDVPPLTAYEDWPSRGIGKVGNIRVDKLESPQDIQRALKTVHGAVGGFDEATRGKVTHEATERLAADLNMSADQLLKRRKGQAFNAEEALAARQILAQSGNELVNMARKVSRLQDPGDEALATFQRAIVRHAAIQEQVSGITAEAGRTLSALRMTANSKEAGLVFNNLVRAGGGAGRIQDAAEHIIDLAEKPGKLNSYASKAAKKRRAAPLVELWYNSLLSGPQTHIVNALSNTITSLSTLPEQAVASGIGGVRRAAGIGKDQDRVLFSELGGRAVGMVQGIKAGLKDGFKTMKTGNPTDFATKVEDQGQKAIPGPIGSILRTPTRALGAADEFFKAIARHGELNSLAIRQADTEGLRGKAAQDRIAELVSNPSDAMVEKARDFSRYLTFTRPLGPIGSKVQGITEEAPILKAILPFVRTPSNLFKFSVERSPAAVFMKEWQKEVAAGGARRDTAIARAVVGSGMMAMAGKYAAEGKITGATPSDRSKAALLRASGWQPYSIKIGDTYHSYQRLDPFASIIGTAADIATLGDGQTDKQRDKGAALLMASVLSNVTSKTWLSGMSDFLSALEDPERNSEWFLKRLAGSVAVPSIVAQGARIQDPTLRAPDTISEYVQSRVPGQSQKLQPRRDVWGKPIVSESGVSPIWRSTEKNDPITDELLDVGASISKPRRDGRDAETYGRYQELTGNIARESLGNLIKTPQYQAMDDVDKADMIKDIMTDARRTARGMLSGDAPAPQAAPPLPARSGEIPPPPPGFTVID